MKLGQQRVYTLDEANAIVPELQERLTRLLQIKEKHEKMREELFMDELLSSALPDGQEPVEAARALDESLDLLEKEMNGLRTFGCILRNLDRGWIDFVGARGSQQVYFSWRLGEKSILYYRPMDDTLTTRLPL